MKAKKATLINLNAAFMVAVSQMMGRQAQCNAFEMLINVCILKWMTC